MTYIVSNTGQLYVKNGVHYLAVREVPPLRCISTLYHNVAITEDGRLYDIKARQLLPINQDNFIDIEQVIIEDEFGNETIAIYGLRDNRELWQYYNYREGEVRNRMKVADGVNLISSHAYNIYYTTDQDLVVLGPQGELDRYDIGDQMTVEIVDLVNNIAIGHNFIFQINDENLSPYRITGRLIDVRVNSIDNQHYYNIEDQVIILEEIDGKLRVLVRDAARVHYDIEPRDIFYNQFLSDMHDRSQFHRLVSIDGEVYLLNLDGVLVNLIDDNKIVISDIPLHIFRTQSYGKNPRSRID